MLKVKTELVVQFINLCIVASLPLTTKSDLAGYSLKRFVFHTGQSEFTSNLIEPLILAVEAKPILFKRPDTAPFALIIK